MKNEYDLLKALTILLVVLGHVTNHYDAMVPALITKGIYLWHMALFIAISGAVYALGCQEGKYLEFIPFFKNKCLRLGVPFLAAAFLILAPTLVLLNKSAESYLTTVCNILVGGGYVKHLWYLQALFWIFIVAWLVRKMKVNLYIAFFGAIILAVLRSELGLSFGPFQIDMAVEKLPMFILGMIFVQGKKFADGKVLLCSGIACCLFAAIQEFTDIHIVDNAIRFLLPAAIVIFIQPLSRIAYPRLKDSKLLAFILRQSFGIYLFHMTFIYLIRYCGCDAWSLWLSIPAIFSFAIIGSVLTTLAVRKVKFGVLIGER